MVVVGKPGLYHFAGVLVTVPASGEVDVPDKVAEEMKSRGFKGKAGKPSKEPPKE